MLEVQQPAQHVVEAGITSLGESAQQVERRSRLPVSLELAVRIGNAVGFGEGAPVDDVAAIARQLLAIDLFGRRRARLGELAGDAPDLHHRHAAGIGEDDGHLQKDAEQLADVVGAVLGKAFGTVAALQ